MEFHVLQIIDDIIWKNFASIINGPINLKMPNIVNNKLR